MVPGRRATRQKPGDLSVRATCNPSGEGMVACSGVTRPPGPTPSSRPSPSHPGVGRSVMTAPLPARSRLALPILLIVACLAGVAGLLLGAVAYSPSAIGAALRHAGGVDATIIREMRLPRVVLAFGVGGTLAVAGAALQALLRNPLAEPWLLGLSGGASLGAVIAIAIGLPAGLSVAGCATLGSLAAVALVYHISSVAGRRLDPRVLLLAGVVVGAFSGAITTAILAVTDPFTFHSA